MIKCEKVASYRLGIEAKRIAGPLHGFESCRDQPNNVGLARRPWASSLLMVALPMIRWIRAGVRGSGLPLEALRSLAVQASIGFGFDP